MHINFSPVAYYEGWQDDYVDFFRHLDDVLSDEAKSQVKCEVILLTHNDKLHEVNLKWHPKGEAYIWQPEIQETKYSPTCGRNLRYERGFKVEIVNQLRN